MRSTVGLYAFNCGEVSKLALGRVDIAKMRLAAQVQVNWHPYVLGPMALRPGLIQVGETLGDNAVKILPFIFSRTDTALVELTPSNMRVWVGEALVTRNSVATVISDASFAGGGTWVTSNTTSGCTATIGSGVATLTCSAIGGLSQIQQTIAVSSGDKNTEHGIRFTITDGPVTVRIGSSAGLADVMGQTVLDQGTHSLTFTPGVTSIVLQIESTDAWAKTLTQVTIEAAGTMIIPTSFASGDLANIRYDQSGDIIFIACYGQQQRKIERRGTRAWSFVLYKSTAGPFFPTATIVANLTPSVYSGTGTLTSDRNFFQAGHVGALFQLFSNGQQNDAVLGAANAFTIPVRVSGVGTTARNYDWTFSGTFAGKITLQRSYDGPTSGFTDVTTGTANSTANLASATGGTASTPDLDNIIAWERVGFKSGNYTSGNVEAQTTKPGGTFGDAKTWNSGGGFGICRVTAFNSPTSVNIEVIQPFSSLNATQNWLEGQWSDATTAAGWPTSVCFHEGRLWWFGQNNIWGSESDAYYGYSNQDNFGNSLGDAGAILEVLGSGDVDTIPWGLSLLRLLVGRERSIASARSSSFDEPMTPTAFSVKDCSTNGSARLPAVKVDQRGIFVQQSGRRVFDLVFNPQRFDYSARDLTRLNLDIGKPGFVAIAVQRQPDSMVHLVRSDGEVAILLDDEEDDVTAWVRVMTQGVIEDTAVLPSSGIEDTVYYAAKRTINGSTKRFIEKLALRDQCVGGAANVQADCCRVYSGAPVSTLTLSWLPNTAVVIWADGQSRGTATSDASGVVTLGGSYSNVVVGLGGTTVSYSGTGASTLTVPTIWNGCPAEVFADTQSNGRLVYQGTFTVSGGLITLPSGSSASRIWAFLGYSAPFMSAKLAYAAQQGTALTQKKQLHHLGIVAQDMHCQALQFGQSFDNMDSLPQVEDGQTVPTTTVWSEYDKPMVENPASWNTDARLCMLAQAPLPVTVNAVALGIVTTEK